MINNKDIIEKLLNFENEGDFYMLYIFKRKKDQPEGEKDNHQSVRTIKTYAIDSVDYLNNRWDEIVGLSEFFKGRVYIHIQKQNHFDVGLNMMEELAKRIRNGVYKQTHIFDSVVGQLNTKEKRWIVDVDTKDEQEVNTIKFTINDLCRPFGDKIIETIPTKNGYHLITDRFDVMSFKLSYPDVDIQKKNPTLLYYPDSLLIN